MSSFSTILGSQDGLVDVASIERELARMWRSAREGKRGAVTRACRTNLVLLMDGGEAPEFIADVTVRHPARLITVSRMAEGDGGRAGGEDAPAPVRAWVSALCHLRPEGGLVCSERIALTVAEGAEARVPSLVRALVLGDLPVAIFGPAEALQRYARAGLLDAADMVMVDTTGSSPDLWKELVGALDAESHRLVDLAWHRLAAFRQVSAYAIMRSPMRKAINRLEAVDIAHSGQPTSALLIAAWLAQRLKWGRPRSPRQLAHGPEADAADETAVDGAKADGDVGVEAAKRGGATEGGATESGGAEGGGAEDGAAEGGAAEGGAAIVGKSSEPFQRIELPGRGRRVRLRIGELGPPEDLVLLLRTADIELRIGLSVEESVASVAFGAGRTRVRRASRRGSRQAQRGVTIGGIGGRRPRERMKVALPTLADCIVSALEHEGRCDRIAAPALSRAREMAGILAREGGRRRPGRRATVEPPSAEAPPVEASPAELAMAERPPAETPPAETPPAETPPAETPPAETPPAETPPAETPPAEAPAAETPPAEAPPAEAPPTEPPPDQTS